MMPLCRLYALWRLRHPIDPVGEFHHRELREAAARASVSKAIIGNGCYGLGIEQQAHISYSPSSSTIVIFFLSFLLFFSRIFLTK